MSVIKINIPNDFVPRTYQRNYMTYFDQGGTRAVWIVHRRGGKDLTALHQTNKMAHRRIGVYWHIFPTFAQARKAIWEGFRKDGKRIMENVFPGFLNPRGPGSIVKAVDKQQMVVELKCGSIWRLLGSDNVELVGAGPLGVVFSEFALSNPQGWRLISPMLRENGGWASFITTPRGRNHAWDLFNKAGNEPGWFRELYTVYDTGLTYASDAHPGQQIGPEEMMEEERRSGMPPEIVRQEYLCDWNAALVGAIYADLIEALRVSGRIGIDDQYEAENRLPVHTAWDLGHSDATAIWFYTVDHTGSVDVIDYYEASGKPLSHYFEVVEGKPYEYAKHFLPHDAVQTTLASGVSIMNQASERWPGKVTVVPKLPIMDGIQAARWLLQRDVSFRAAAQQGVDALGQYHYEFDLEKKVLSARPAHDWSSHGADAFRYLASTIRATEKIAPRPPAQPVIGPPEPYVKPAHNQFTLEDLFKIRENDRRMRARRI